MKTTLTATDELTTQIRDMGIRDWEELVNFIQLLPYGRTQQKRDLSLVISEGKGTCSSKHALLKKVADQNQIPHIVLLLGIYKMNSKNTTGIGTVLDDEPLDFLPEAHCYLCINGIRKDVTGPNSDIRKIETELLEEQSITPEQIFEFKENYHKEFLRKWLREQNLAMTFEELWKIREACIAKLSQNPVILR